MIPGPTPLSAAVRAALAEPVRNHVSAEHAATMGRIQEGLRACVGSPQARVHAVSGSGTLAMEMALVNHVRPGERIVVCSHGFFGDRFAEIAATLGIEATVVAAEWGEHVDPGRLGEACAAGPPPVLVTITHVDTSTGVLADVPALVAAARDSGALAVLDAVCAAGGVTEEMEAWGIDIVLTGAQKALGLPPGLALLAVSERARERREQIGPIAAFYADLHRWDPVVEEPAHAYFSTPPTSLLRALEVSLDEIAAEGLPQRFERHRRNAEWLRSGMAELGLQPLTAAECLAPTLSALRVPAQVDEAQLRAEIAREGVVVAGCLGRFAGRGIRIGHMGSAGAAEVERTLNAAAAALQRLHPRVTSSA